MTEKCNSLPQPAAKLSHPQDAVSCDLAAAYRSSASYERVHLNLKDAASCIYTDNANPCSNISIVFRNTCMSA